MVVDPLSHSVGDAGDQIPGSHNAADKQESNVGEAEPGDHGYDDVVFPALPHLPM